MKYAVFTVIFFFLWIKISSQDTLIWKFYHPLKNEWKTFGSKGSIQQKLIASGELPAPFLEKNDEKFRWIENHTWRLKTEIFVNEKYNNPTLVCQNIDTYGEIIVNGENIYSASNYFIPHEISLDKYLKNGINTIEIILTPPRIYHKERFNTEAFHYPAPNDVDSIYVSALTRKPQFHFGWDWTARINTIGIDKPVIFYKNSTSFFHDISIETKEIIENKAVLTAHLKVDTTFEGFVKSKYIPKTSINQLSNQGKITMYIMDPKVWNPVGVGNAKLYYDTLLLLNQKNEIIEIKPFYFGIRSVKLNQDQDSIGTKFQLCINKNPIFCVGMNIIPPRVFLSELTPEVYDTLIQQIKVSNANMVRIWGGGTYFDDYFYEQCSNYGIMVWHDFMFACAMYPGEHEFLDNLEKEIEYQSFRLSKHPCVILFNGNNEVEVAWKYWGLQNQYKLDESAQKTIETSYNQIFQISIPGILAKNTTLPYTHTSPLSNWGLPERFDHGTQHYWGVWHGNDQISDFSKNIGRFNAEYGFQSFPSPKTMTYITDHENWDLANPILSHHQKSYVGNKKIAQHALKYFKKPKNFMEFLYQSQLVQKIAMETAIKAHRLNAPRCMGSLFWQFNDCYPGPTWSSLDYFNQPKAIFYTLPYLFHSNAILFEKGEFYASATNLSSKKQEIIFNFYTKKGEKISKKNKFVEQSSWNQKLQVKIPEKTHVIEVINRDLRHLEFLYPTRNCRSKGKIKLQKMNYSKETGVGTLFFQVKKPIQELFFYDSAHQLFFLENFSSYLPGEHSISFKSNENPGKIEFFYH
jgi:beta-mannosidase